MTELMESYNLLEGTDLNESLGSIMEDGQTRSRLGKLPTKVSRTKSYPVRENSVRSVRISRINNDEINQLSKTSNKNQMYQNQQRHNHNASMSGMDLSAIMNDDDSFFNAYENSLI